MKLYKRQLKSLADLKREKVLLEYVKGEHDAADLFTLDGLKQQAGKKKKNKNLAAAESDGNSWLTLAMSMLGLGSGSEASGVLPFLESGNPTMQLASRLFPEKQAKALVWEIVGGYLKWRAVEGGIWLVKKAIENRKEKKRFAFEAEMYDPRLKRRRVKVKKRKKGFLGLF